MNILTFDAIVVGSGAAGLTAALELAPARVAVVTKGLLGLGGSSAAAQGGIAAAVGTGDTPALHAADTLAAGAGLADPAIVDLLTEEGPGRVMRLLVAGAAFDRRPDGSLALGREAAHGRRRILHARGDATGAEVMRTLTDQVRAAEHVTVFERTFAWDLTVDPARNGRATGLVAVTDGGERLHLRAPAVVLATGGVGRLFARTTNPVEVTGDGLGLAARAGARLLDVEMVQFHPTALAAAGADPLPLLTEALRGEGAVLIETGADGRDGRGMRFMPSEHPDAELAPRDVVARAIDRRLAAGVPVFLDAREAVGTAFPEHFPTVFALCRRHGIDPRTEPMPVSPAAHYHMGGVESDAWGKTTLPGLWVCGEAAASGVHGANRLASNSLLEALVFGARVARSIEGAHVVPVPVARVPQPPPAGARRLPPEAEGEAAVARLRALTWRFAGVERSGDGLATLLDALAAFEPLAPAMGGEGRNLLLAARLVTEAALVRTESRGGHYRSDFPEPRDVWRRHLAVELGADGAPRFVPMPRLAPAAEPAAEEAAR